MMDVKMGLFSGECLRRMFGRQAGFAERRAASLPVMVERRQGPRCEACGVGTLHPIPAGQPHAGGLWCGSPECGIHANLVGANLVRADSVRANSVRDNAWESVIRAS